MNRWIPITAVAAALTAALAAAAFGGGDDATPAPAASAATTGAAPQQQEPAPVAAPAAATPATPAAPAPKPEPKPDAVASYPDGTRMPALNGATDSVQMPWPPQRPWSPIVDKVVDHGQEWYRHADGCWSTTVTTWDPAAREYRTAGQLFEPVPAGQTVLRGGS